MWRRWNNQYGNRSPYIGNPVLIETTVEEGYLETIPEVDSIKSKRSSGGTTLPELPFRAMPYSQGVSQPQYREPVWSQPSPTIPEYYVSQDQSLQDNQYPYVSPINSPPRTNLDAASEVSSISPIEPDGASTSRLSLLSDNWSRIPQRVVSDKAKRAEHPDQEKQETRWDVYSGEPTKDKSGLPSTVRPGAQPVEHQYPQLKERTKQILAGLREREAANRQQLVPQTLPVAPTHPHNNVVHKEPWKGYSGRSALIDPIQDNPSARSEPIHQLLRDVNYTEPDDPIPRTESPTHTLRSIPSEESIKPVAPLKIVTKSRNASPQTSQSSMGSNTPPFFDAIHSAPPTYQQPKMLQSPFSSPGPHRSIDIPAPLVSARADTPPNDLVPDTPRTPPLPMAYQNDTPIKIQQMPNEPDVSRFSWTTYATTTVTDSPGSMARIFHGESSPPPMPPVPKLIIKKRPVSESNGGTLYINTSATPPQSTMVTRKPVGGRPRQSSGGISQLSLSKTLPQIPSELEAKDKIAGLEAQMNALAVRKYNTTRIIQNLNESLQRNAVAYDMWKRKDIGERIADQEEELQTITNEEHELGLLLHRAQRKRDKDDNYEVPTGLWIRRVTS